MLLIANHSYVKSHQLSTELDRKYLPATVCRRVTVVVDVEVSGGTTTCIRRLTVSVQSAHTTVVHLHQLFNGYCFLQLSRLYSYTSKFVVRSITARVVYFYTRRALFATFE